MLLSWWAAGRIRCVAIKRKGPKIKGKPRGRSFKKDRDGGDKRRHPPRYKKNEPSPNPAGRPKERYSKADVTRVAQEMAPAALNRLDEIVRLGKHAVAKMAADSILDRAVGKPKQEQEINDKRENADELVARGLDRLAAAIRARGGVDGSGLPSGEPG